MDGIGQDRAGRWGSEGFAEGDLTGRKAGSPGTFKSAQWVPFVGSLSGYTQGEPVVRVEGGEG